MNYIEKYLSFCKKFHRFRLPKLKFKVLSDRFNDLYKKLYGIDENDINKASFTIFLASITIIIIILINLTGYNILILSLISILISLIIAHRFNLILYNKINKKESLINAMLYLIKIDFSLIHKLLKKNSDYALNFITLIKDYNLPLSYDFKVILKNVHEGLAPEDELIKLITPSKDFDDFLKYLLINNFKIDSTFMDNNENDLEKKFKIFLRELQSRISIIFFIGLFFPLGLCFLILFQLINMIILLLFVPLFLFLLNILFRKLVKKNSYLIGVLNNYSKLETRKFNEFVIFLRSFANNLKSNASPEKCYIKSYRQNKNQLILLNQPIKSIISGLINFNYSFNEMVDVLKLKMKNFRYSVIMDVIQKCVNENSYYSSEKILDLLNIISKHQKMGEKLEIIIKGEKFKIYFFIFLLPILIGAISGMIPFFILIQENIDFDNNMFLNDMSNLIKTDYLIVILIVLISSVLITSNYFLNVINHQNKPLILFIVTLIFILTFLSSFMNVMTFI